MSKPIGLRVACAESVRMVGTRCSLNKTKFPLPDSYLCDRRLARGGLLPHTFRLSRVEKKARAARGTAHHSPSWTSTLRAAFHALPWRRAGGRGAWGAGGGDWRLGGAGGSGGARRVAPRGRGLILVDLLFDINLKQLISYQKINVCGALTACHFVSPPDLKDRVKK